MMNQKDYPQQGMNGYSQPNAFYPNPPYIQNNKASYENPPVPGGQQPGAYDGYRPSAPQGYAAPSYQSHTGYTTPQVPFAQTVNNGYGQERQPVQPYNPVQAVPGNPYMTSPSYTIPQQNGNAGSFIPQTPYSPGYTSPGYQPPQQQGYMPPQQGYPSGYSPYSQMGRNQASSAQPEFNPNPAIPLNGGGYVPQKVPVRRRPFVMKDLYLVIMGAVLITLFVIAVIVTGNPALKIALIVLALVSAGILWLRQLVADNKRLTYSVLALALCVLTAVSFIIKQPADTTNKGTINAQSSVNNTGNSQEIPLGDSNASQNTQPEITPAPETNTDTMKENLVSFFTYWAKNKQDEMLQLCSPNWVNKQENPRTSLFILLGNRKPKNCTLESVTGTEADNSRKVTLTSLIDRNDGREPELYRMTVLMVKENNQWYIDPQSLKSYDTAVTTDPNITSTPAPTDTPAIYSSTPLYYNPNGGEYYHYDPYCKNVGKKNTPLQGVFTYGEVNDEPYSKLKPCNVCGAPLRP